MTDHGVLPDVIERFLDEPVTAPSLADIRTKGAAVRRRRRRVAVASGAAVLLVIGGVVAGQTLVRPDDRRDAPNADGDTLPTADLSVLESAGIGDALIYDDPATLADDRSIVAAGEIAGFADGNEVLERGSAQEGYDVRDYTVVVQVKVTTIYKGSADDLDASGSIYLTLSRGAAQEGVENDEKGPPTVTPVEAFEEAIPIGTEVVVFGSAPYLFDRDSEVIDRFRGVPEGGMAYTAGHPQALAFATPDGGNTTWRGHSLAELRSLLADQYVDSDYSFGDLQCNSNLVSSGDFDVIPPATPEEAREQDWPRTPREAAIGPIGAPFVEQFGALTLSDGVASEHGTVRFAGINAEGRRVVILTVDELVEGAWAMTGADTCSE
jgi:hypothetical protein